MKAQSLWRTLAVSAVAAAMAVAPVFGQAVGESSTEIAARGAQRAETPAGNLVADAARTAVNAETAIIAAGALSGKSLAAGPLTRESLASLLDQPEDAVVLLSLTGAQLQEALERSVGVGVAWPGFLQVSGLKVTYNPKAKTGSRVSAVQVNGSALQMDRKYRVATLQSLAGGALGYFVIWEKDATQSGDGSIGDALAAHVKSAGTVSPHVEGRIVSR